MSRLPDHARVRSLAGYLFDLDGTLYLGGEAIPGAADAVARLKARGARVRYMTNKPLYSATDYAEKLTGLGIPALPAEVLTSALALASYMSSHHPRARVLVCGEEVVREELGRAGLVLVEGSAAVDIVVLSWDRTFTYDKLDQAMQALAGGALFYATNPDVACPMGGGCFAPDCGALIAALASCSGRSPDFIAGKPGPGMPQAALRDLGLQPAQCLLVGDRLETDIVCGHRAGLNTALVLTGATSPEMAAAAAGERRPDYILQSVADLR